MKHIKTYETINADIRKYNIGDYVRYDVYDNNNKKNHTIYKIISCYKDDILGFRYFLENLKGTSLSNAIREKFLKPVPEHEIDAIKYNL
jgi:hypothetical protein